VLYPGCCYWSFEPGGTGTQLLLPATGVRRGADRIDHTTPSVGRLDIAASSLAVQNASDFAIGGSPATARRRGFLTARLVDLSSLGLSAFTFGSHAAGAVAIS